MRLALLQSLALVTTLAFSLLSSSHAADCRKPHGGQCATPRSCAHVCTCVCQSYASECKTIVPCGAATTNTGSSEKQPHRINITIVCPKDTVVKINHYRTQSTGSNRSFFTDMKNATEPHFYKIEVIPSDKDQDKNFETKTMELWRTAEQEPLTLFYDVRDDECQLRDLSKDKNRPKDKKRPASPKKANGPMDGVGEKVTAI